MTGGIPIERIERHPGCHLLDGRLIDDGVLVFQERPRVSKLAGVGNGIRTLGHRQQNRTSGAEAVVPLANSSRASTGRPQNTGAANSRKTLIRWSSRNAYAAAAPLR